MTGYPETTPGTHVFFETTPGTFVFLEPLFSSACAEALTKQGIRPLSKLNYGK